MLLQPTLTTQNDEDVEKERLLSILDAHGQQFLSAFDIPPPKHVADSDGPESGEEWTGLKFSPSPNRDTSETDSNDEHDNNFAVSSSHAQDVTVFLESRKQPSAGRAAKELRKSFMSSKVSNITPSSMQLATKEKIPDGESDDELTNIQNDALLHRLVHTKLLSGSLNPELNLSHAQRGNAMTGRVLELAGEAKFGKGESVFRQQLRNKAAKHVRDGLTRKQIKQDKRALEEAKNLGNYHPTLKRIYDSNSSSVPKKKRARGLGMGIGKFAGGTLKLSREEIASATRSGGRSQDNSRGMREHP